MCSTCALQLICVLPLLHFSGNLLLPNTCLTLPHYFMAQGKQHIIYTLNKGEEVTLTVYARERYSLQRIAVKRSEAYMIRCDEDQRWYDLIIPSSPNGYRNPLAAWFGLRVYGEKCHCLCGAWNESDKRTFATSTDTALVVQPMEEGTLSFFANDVLGYEWNNWGSIQVKVMRTI